MRNVALLYVVVGCPLMIGYSGSSFGTWFAVGSALLIAWIYEELPE